MTLAPTLTTLDSLKAGQSATVIHLAPTGQHGGADVPRRLMELGFVPGERIRMLKRGFTRWPSRSASRPSRCAVSRPR
jgi:ferrous iron transport protein A